MDNVKEMGTHRIELQYKVFSDKNFWPALDSVCSSTYRWETAKRLVKIKKDLMKAAQDIQDEYVKGLEQFEYEVDEVKKTKKPKDPEAIKKYEVSCLEKTFVINRKPIHINDLNADKVTPNQLITLEPILTGLED